MKMPLAWPDVPALSAVRPHEKVIGTLVDVVDHEFALDRVQAWARVAQSRYVCFCNVHALVLANWDGSLRAALDAADLVSPDGAPVAWMLRRLGHPGQERVSGPDFFWRYCARAAASGEAMFLLGSTPRTLERLERRLREHFPGLRIAGMHSPPFRPLDLEEDRALIERINASGASTVWVSLGCPKQEIWMSAHRASIRAVMLGVGAAFDFHAGTVPYAPAWMRRFGLEWLHRLVREPRRLWKRYLVTNSLFILMSTRQLLSDYRHRARK